MNRKKVGAVAVLSAVVSLGGMASTSASARGLAAPKPYGCAIHPKQKKCQTGTGGTRVTGGTGSGVGSNVAGGRGKGGKGNGAGGANVKGANANGANANGANANGASPIPGKGLPVTGYGGTAQELGASPRVASAGSQPVVVGLTSASSTQRVTALPATGGGGTPTQPMSPVPAIIATALAVLGLGLRKVSRSL